MDENLLETLSGRQDIFNQQVDNYINDIISTAGGNRDFIIQQLERDHELALGTDDSATAEFLETVANKLEEKIGRIPFDYQTGVTRTQEDLVRVEEVTQRNKERVLGRLSEDEQVFREQFDKESEEGKELQQESLLKRGILQGTREGAVGLAGEEVSKFDEDLSKQLETFERALGRKREDVGTEAEDILFGARREAGRTLEDLQTQARRGAIDAQDVLKFGTEAERIRFEKAKKEAEAARDLLRRQSGTVALG